MTEATAEMPPEPVPVPPPPEETAAIDATPPQADEPAVGELESFDPRIAIPDSLGLVRRSILEGLIDGEGPLSVAQLHALMPAGTSKNSAESAIRREHESGRIERVGAGQYALSKPKPPGQPKPPPAPAPLPEDEVAWFSALEAWLVESSTWNVAEAAPPKTPALLIG
jgi:hypothetical protein